MVVADVTEEVVEGGPPVRELIQANGNDAIFLRCDVSRGEDVDAMFACVLAQPGRVDILVNNAAIRAGQPLAETDEAL